MDAEELRLFGRLVRCGLLRQEQVEQALEQSEATGRALADVVVGKGWLTAERLALLRRTGGEDVPALPGYEWKELLGKGGTAIVLRAEEKKTGKSVAVKVLSRELTDVAEARASFLREARLLIGLHHENVVRGHKVGTYQGRLIFLMEYVPGRSLQTLLREGQSFGEDAALYIVLQVARALHYLSEAGVVHRDVKPGNILLTRQNQVKLIDLGFAASGALEDSQTTVGTVAYISPEQARGQGDLDVRSDIYSLGATLYQLVVGELPFQADSNQDLLAAQILASLSSEVLKSRKISPHMHYFIEKMMAKEREVRYQSPAELIQDIEEQIRGKKSLVFDPDAEPDRDRELLDKPYADEEPAAKPPFPVRRRRRRRR